jgi:hypothetical protein
MMAVRAESSTAGSGKAKAVQDSAASAGYELPWYSSLPEIDAGWKNTDRWI